MEHIRKHQQTIVLSLKDSDISIRRRALDLLYCMCDRSNAGEIVGELLEYLPVADFNIREDLVCALPLDYGVCLSHPHTFQVLKIAILSEKFAIEFSWYVDVIMNIIQQAGDFVSDDVYYRVVQIITNNEDIQRHSADIVFKACVQRIFISLALVCVSAPIPFCMSRCILECTIRDRRI